MVDLPPASALLIATLINSYWSKLLCNENKASSLGSQQGQNVPWESGGKDFSLTHMFVSSSSVFFLVPTGSPPLFQLHLSLQHSVQGPRFCRYWACPVAPHLQLLSPAASPVSMLAYLGLLTLKSGGQSELILGLLWPSVGWLKEHRTGGM